MLVATLQDLASDWDITAAPLVLSAESRPLGFLQRLLTFNVQGLQTGNWNTQRNTFQYYVTDVPRVDQLLRQDPALATTLADFLCPETGQLGNFDAFRSQLETTLNALPLGLAGRLSSLGLAAPEPGAELHVRGVDGLTVGENNQIRTEMRPQLHIGLATPAVPEIALPTLPETPQPHGPETPDQLGPDTPYFSLF